MKNKQEKQEEKKSFLEEDEAKDLKKIWDELNKPEFRIYGLPKQKVNMFCTPIFVEPSALYVKFTNSSVLPALEENFPHLNFELKNKYIAVTRKKEEDAS